MEQDGLDAQGSDGVAGDLDGVADHHRVARADGVVEGDGAELVDLAGPPDLAVLVDDRGVEPMHGPAALVEARDLAAGLVDDAKASQVSWASRVPPGNLWPTARLRTTRSTTMRPRASLVSRPWPSR